MFRFLSFWILLTIITVSVSTSNVGATPPNSLLAVKGVFQPGGRKLLKSLSQELHEKRIQGRQEFQPAGQQQMPENQEATEAMKALSAKFQEITSSSKSSPQKSSGLGFVDRNSLRALTKDQLVEEAYRAIQERDRAQLAAARIAYNCTSQVEKLALKNALMQDSHGKKLESALQEAEDEKRRAAELAQKHEELSKQHEEIAKKHEEASSKNEAMQTVLRRHAKLIASHIDLNEIKPSKATSAGAAVSSVPSVMTTSESSDAPKVVKKKTSTSATKSVPEKESSSKTKKSG